MEGMVYPSAVFLIAELSHDLRSNPDQNQRGTSERDSEGTEIRIHPRFANTTVTLGSDNDFPRYTCSRLMIVSGLLRTAFPLNNLSYELIFWFPQTGVQQQNPCGRSDLQFSLEGKDWDLDRQCHGIARQFLH
jgi:hypothetical protein